MFRRSWIVAALLLVLATTLCVSPAWRHSHEGGSEAHSHAGGHSHSHPHIHSHGDSQGVHSHFRGHGHSHSHGPAHSHEHSEAHSHVHFRILWFEFTLPDLNSVGKAVANSFSGNTDRSIDGGERLEFRSPFTLSHLLHFVFLNLAPLPNRVSLLADDSDMSLFLTRHVISGRLREAPPTPPPEAC